MAFTGTIGEDGTVRGTFTYDHNSQPSATNVRSLAPNVLYPLKAWNFTVNGGSLTAVLPSTVYSSDIQGDTATFCQGTCVFSSGAVAEVLLRNSTSFILQIVFTSLDLTPYVDPPTSLEWGPMVQSVYRVPCPVCSPVAILQNGVMAPAAL